MSETPLSPTIIGEVGSTEDRKISESALLRMKRLTIEELQNKLLLRVSKSELLLKNILISDSQTDRDAIEKSLDLKLTRRPSHNELRDRNILKGGEGLSPNLHEAHFNLHKQRLEDNLSRSIGNRPTKTSLVEQHILEIEQEEEQTSEE
ncbi:RPEL repeat protein [Planoprotostelium fungivorum]|uniref:RPEL repeat protein n=1 Tax=Planoprotostelium fungivorum TaxID=1890364 RepID=A0A2P6MQT9_9EUKA|nr:RPEL repeat protein [Planoprotostelium fungivorum]